MIYAFYDSRIPVENAEHLRALGFFAVPIPECTSFSAPVCAHTDLQMVSLGDTLLIHPELAQRMPSLARANGVIIDEFLPDEKSHEARLCALIGGGRLFGNTRLLSRALLSTAMQKGLKIVHTNQGFAACSTRFVDAHHAITADEGMHRALCNEGIEVLKISEGGVLLPPYPYGFIGGASGLFEDCVYFIGSLIKHPDGERIRAYIEDLGMHAVSLSDGALFDGGGIVFWESEERIFLKEHA